MYVFLRFFHDSIMFLSEAFQFYVIKSDGQGTSFDEQDLLCDVFFGKAKVVFTAVVQNQAAVVP